MDALLAGGVAAPGAAADGLPRWTAEEDEKALALIHRGKPFPYIARELGRSEGACRQRIRALQTRTAGAAD